MKLSVKAFALASSALWGGAILFAGCGHALWPPYGQAFLDVIASVYPGLGNVAGSARIVAATAYGLVDGAVAGGLAAWIYNKLAR